MLAGSKLGLGFFVWSLPRPAQRRCLTSCKFTRCVQTSAREVIRRAKGKGAVAVHDERYLVDGAEITGTGHTAPPTWMYKSNKFTSKTRTAAAKHRLGDENAKYRCAGGVSHSHTHRGRQKLPVPTQSPQGYQAAPRDKRLEQRLHVLLTAPTIPNAWTAYRYLITNYPYNPLQKPVIPYGHLHRLAARLASVKPRTRTLYLQLSSVLATLRRTGGRIFVWEWNALIDCAGKQWRKTSIADYRTALDIFNDMKTPPRLPEHPASDDTFSNSSPSQPSFSTTSWSPVKPDITTYTTLLSIAVRSKQDVAVRHASKLLRLSDCSPTRFTYLTLLSFYARTNQLSEVRSTLQKMKQQGVEVGMIGLNTCIWAFANNGRMDIACMIYRVLRYNVVRETGSMADDIAATARHLRDTEHLDIPPGFSPNRAVYTSMIQCSAYRGNMVQALHVFADMLSMPSRHLPSMAAFRAIFLGFYRHGRRLGPTKFTDGLTTQEQRHLPELSAWNLDNLTLVFKAFMDLPKGVKANGRLLYWIIVAFWRLSGNDPVVLRNVWEQLEGKYGRGWDGRLERIGRAIYSSQAIDRKDRA